MKAQTRNGTPRNGNNVTRATLDNGLRVVIIRDPLAPVVTLENNYLVGGNETPAGFPGMAHAQEHMMFRGCSGLTADQIAAIYAQLGGYGNADTQQNITQYFVTVPAQDLDVALRVDANCMKDAPDLQSQWDGERGAIEQEVARDLSNPTYKFITRLNQDLFAGTPYDHDALGTKESFDKTTGAMLQKFYRDWYAPNNAILVIAGNVDPEEILAKVKQYYGPVPRRDIPARPEVHLQPVKADSFNLPCNLPYTLAFVAFRMPGTDSPDFAAARVLSDVLSSQRGDLYGLVPQGKALGTEFAMLETYPKASAAFAVAAVPSEVDPAAITAEMKQILQNYVAKGLPPDLVEAAKKGEIAGAEFARNSIPNLAAAWSQALAAEGRQSPDDLTDAIRRVTVDDVNRAAKKYLAESNAITATLETDRFGSSGLGERIRRIGSHHDRAHQARGIARLGRSGGEVPGRSAAQFASGGSDPAQRHPIDRTDGKDQPDRDADRLHQNPRSRCRPRPGKMACPTCWVASSPTEQRRWTGWPFKRNWMISRPRKRRAPVSI